MSAIDLNSISKRFRVDVSGHGPRIHRLFERTRVERWALRNVSFAVERGEAVGIIGKNGSGKSTLLRIAGGVTAPTKGRVTTNGHLGGLLTLGGVMEPELTGVENAITGAMLAGLTHREAVRRLPEIVEFSELGAQVEQPLRTFSDGMRLRLAFAVAIHVEPEILLIDEILAVGDLQFRQKCLERLEELISRGTTLLLTSHDVLHVQRLCSRAVWLHEGQVRDIGDVDAVTERYRKALTESMAPATQLADGSARRGTGAVSINDIRVVATETNESRIVSGSAVMIDIDFETSEAVDNAIIGVHVHIPESGVHCLNVSTDGDDVRTGVWPKSGTVRLTIDRLDLAAGCYYLDVGVYERDWQQPYLYWWRARAFEVTGGSPTGIVAPPRHWSFV